MSGLARSQLAANAACVDDGAMPRSSSPAARTRTRSTAAGGAVGAALGAVIGAVNGDPFASITAGAGWSW